ncbi:MAG: hypothetical protein INR71_04900 [Terriglobus roseus]|nr:hypothetical protein [Terriglobus roseus]
MRRPAQPSVQGARSSAPTKEATEESDDDDSSESDEDEDEIDGEDSASDEDDVLPDSDLEQEEAVIVPPITPADHETTHSRRKRKRQEDDLEDQYMQRLAKDEAKEEAKRQAQQPLKRKKTSGEEKDGEEAAAEAKAESDLEGSVSDDAASPPPQHESLSDGRPDLEKASRTVFLGNVSSDAISSKSARKTLLSHLTSHLPPSASSDPAPKVESLRFRSTAYANALPKRAAFAKRELMAATTKSTNAYAVYATRDAARLAARRLNGTVVLGRHLRVDEVAHPAKTDHRRCVFVGNLGFVDDETAMRDAADADAGKGPRKKQKEPSDAEEGLWREFGKAGAVESVRVVRDAKTRVGKGFAYVQFADENAVEAALLFNDKKFPPLLPRKLRVVRAKAAKRNAAAPGRSGAAPPNAAYVPKVSAEQRSVQGRAGKLFGKAGAAQMHSGSGKKPKMQGFKPPEAFLFEGHRATGGQKPKLKAKKGKVGGKPQSRSSKRGAAWKAAGGKKK